MNIAVCDDIEKSRNFLVQNIKHYYVIKNYKIEFSVKCFSSAESLLQFCKSDIPFDVIFLDIYMNAMNGMDCAKNLRQLGFGGQIVFITTSNEFAVDAFRVHALDYIAKPFVFADFSESMDIIMSKNSKLLKHIEITSNYEKRIVCLKDIYSIQTEGRNTVVLTKDESLKTIKTLQYYTDLLNNEKNFYRCHRCCIVNFNHIIKCNDNNYEFDNGSKVYLKTRNKAEAKNAYYDFQFTSLDKI